MYRHGSIASGIRLGEDVGDPLRLRAAFVLEAGEQALRHRFAQRRIVSDALLPLAADGFGERRLHISIRLAHAQTALQGAQRLVVAFLSGKIAGSGSRCGDTRRLFLALVRNGIRAGGRYGLVRCGLCRAIAEGEVVCRQRNGGRFVLRRSAHIGGGFFWCGFCCLAGEGNCGSFGCGASGFIHQGDVIKGGPFVVHGRGRGFRDRNGSGSTRSRCGTVGESQLARQGIERLLFALRRIQKRQAHPLGDQCLLQQRAFMLDKFVLCLQDIEQGNGVADGVAHQRVGGKIFFDNAVEQLFMLPGKFAQRFVTNRAPGAFQGMESAADVRSVLCIIGIFTPLRIDFVHCRDDFAQLFIEELADFLVHDRISMAAHKGHFFGGNVKALQIGQRLVSEVGNTDRRALRTGGSGHACRCRWRFIQRDGRRFNGAFRRRFVCDFQSACVFCGGFGLVCFGRCGFFRGDFRCSGLFCRKRCVVCGSGGILRRDGFRSGGRFGSGRCVALRCCRLRADHRRLYRGCWRWRCSLRGGRRARRYCWRGRIIACADGNGVIARSAALRQAHREFRRGRNGIVAGKHDWRRLWQIFFFRRFFLLLKNREIVCQDFQPGAQSVFEFLNVARIFYIVF